MENDLISRSELLENYGLKDAVKYGNKTRERAYHSVDTLMLYEIADMIESAPAVDAVPVVHGLHCIDIVDFIDWLDVGHLRSADEKCFSEANVAGMLKDFAITNPAIPDSVTRCKDCRYGLPCKLFGRDAITCTEHREEIHPMDWYCADAAKMDGKDDAK